MKLVLAPLDGRRVLKIMFASLKEGLDFVFAIAQGRVLLVKGKGGGGFGRFHLFHFQRNKAEKPAHLEASEKFVLSDSFRVPLSSPSRV